MYIAIIKTIRKNSISVSTNSADKNKKAICHGTSTNKPMTNNSRNVIKNFIVKKTAATRAGDYPARVVLHLPVRQQGQQGQQLFSWQPLTRV